MDFSRDFFFEEKCHKLLQSGKLKKKNNLSIVFTHELCLKKKKKNQ